MSTELKTDRLVTDLKRVVEDSEDLLVATKDAVGEKMHDVRNRMTKALDSAKRTYRRASDEAIAGAKVADRTIREHPYPSIGVALGVGILVGLLIARK